MKRQEIIKIKLENKLRNRVLFQLNRIIGSVFRFPRHEVRYMERFLRNKKVYNYIELNKL